MLIPTLALARAPVFQTYRFGISSAATGMEIKQALEDRWRNAVPDETVLEKLKAMELRLTSDQEQNMAVQEEVISQVMEHRKELENVYRMLLPR